jgi:hypothetical protein
MCNSRFKIKKTAFFPHCRFTYSFHKILTITGDSLPTQSIWLVYTAHYPVHNSRYERVSPSLQNKVSPASSVTYYYPINTTTQILYIWYLFVTTTCFGSPHQSLTCRALGHRTVKGQASPYKQIARYAEFQMSSHRFRTSHRFTKDVTFVSSVLNFSFTVVYNRGTPWRSWLRHCATSRKAAGSIPDGVIRILH